MKCIYPIFSLILIFSSLNASLPVDKDIKALESLILAERPNASILENYHTIQSIDRVERIITLEDDSQWRIGWWHRNGFNDWASGHRVKVSFGGGSNDIKLDNIDLSQTIWGAIEKAPKEYDFILRKSQFIFGADNEEKIILKSGAIFKNLKNSWKVRDPIFVFYSDSQAGECDLWNLRTHELIKHFIYLGNEIEGSSESILNLEKALNKRVIGQKKAVQTVSDAMVNYWSGLNNSQTPIGVFLFLGPSGVGKTELAKSLCLELFQNKDQMIRFDMSLFSESHSVARLVGSPPGYVNHEEGGQLTEALRKKPQSVVLLDEIEKAHPFVRKLFLPVFDDGFLNDAKNRKIQCRKAIFIMTSNLCGQDIAQLGNLGYDEEEILEKLEPTLIEYLSPEFYNRVMPVVFRPLTEDLMENLVNLLLNDIIIKINDLRKINLIIDDSVKNYLIVNGFHPTLGARPLRKLIQNKVVATVSYAIIKEGIPDGVSLQLLYDEAKDEWKVVWE